VPEIGKRILAADITPERLYVQRREFLRNSLLFMATSAESAALCSG
jgi:hypothetical protein